LAGRNPALCLIHFCLSLCLIHVSLSLCLIHVSLGLGLIHIFRYVSHAVPNTSDVKAFYKAVFEVDPVYEYTDADGTRYAQFQLVPTSLVHLVFVERPNQIGTFYNALWFAKFMDTTNRKYMGNSYKGCWVFLTWA